MTDSQPKSARVWKRLLIGSVVVASIAAAAHFVSDEAQTSRLQARYLSGLAQGLTYKVEPGPSNALRFPNPGPYDDRLGYSHIPDFVKRLGVQGYQVSAQARMSGDLLRVTDNGIFTAYHEPSQAGLQILDCSGQAMYAVRFPERVYPRFEAIPDSLVDALLFIENRELLDATYPTHNPAIEWSRLGKALITQVARHVSDAPGSAGGSTLATQIEKFRHSPDGRTSSMKEKLRQVASASVRAYLDGEDTRGARRRIVLDYVNSVPLSAKPGVGEVHGVGDGLWAWYGRDFAEVNALLNAAIKSPAAPGPELLRQAEAYKQVLSLFIAQRRPSYYLVDGHADLQRLADSHLRLLASVNLIPIALRDAALPIKLKLHPVQPTERPVSFVDRKAITAMRSTLSTMLKVPRLYDLDRLDLKTNSTLDGELQRTATRLLSDLKDPKLAKTQGLYGFHMLQEGDDPSKLTLSFTLFERSGQANLLRVQSDNLDQPFDINEGAKLDLGSTAKLRTLITYLKIIADLHGQYSPMSEEDLTGVPVQRKDVLRRWARDYLLDAKDKSLTPMLEAAMDRKYSASPGETFFTGGGAHHFNNFESNEDGRVMDLREAFQHSVNLVFIRLMRDVVYTYMANNSQADSDLLEDSDDPRRQEYLARFADSEGREFLRRFYKKYKGKSPEAARALLTKRANAAPSRLAAIHRGIDPQATVAEFTAFMNEQLPQKELGEAKLQRLYDDYALEKFSLADRGYIARVHPLDLWLVGHLKAHPKATLTEVMDASRDQRQEVYGWLFKTRHKTAQDSRIRNLLERDAFTDLNRDWRRLGYPFATLTPSYATALGASGDRPAALAELMGIIVNKGMRMPVSKLQRLDFASGTPFETRLEQATAKAERVLPEEVADVVRRTLLTVVEGGTARRLKGAFVRPDGSVIEVGGKTGTGDHRFDVHGPGGGLISSRVVNRSATFVFLIGDRFFGTLTAYVHEPYAAKYTFTSALSAQVLKALAPALMPLVQEKAPDGPGSCRKKEPLVASKR
ncbi:transglycosylase domain-containing protein [Aquabacterium sp.]|uniref:transglycosylase domain-containing protein n=1 Tax=Aquabacterium sp. TaxID=1872578 RepID=UPI0025C6F55A|nr:transglycosylase domain-containing protein [Aquabacterium sp.]